MRNDQVNKELVSDLFLMQASETTPSSSSQRRSGSPNSGLWRTSAAPPLPSSNKKTNFDLKKNSS